MRDLHEKKYFTEHTRMVRSLSKGRIGLSSVGVLLVSVFFQFPKWYMILLAILCIVGIGYSIKTMYNRKQYLLDEQGFTFLQDVIKGESVKWEHMTSLVYVSNEYRFGKRFDHFVITLNQTDSPTKREYPFVITEDMDIGLVELYIWFIQNGVPVYQMSPATSTFEQIDLSLDDEEVLFEKGAKLEMEIFRANEDVFNHFPFRPIWKPAIFVMNTLLAIIGLLILMGLGYLAFDLAFSNDPELAEWNQFARYATACGSLILGLFIGYQSWVHGVYAFFGLFLASNLSEHRTRFGQFLYNHFYRIKL